jgi:hypothetical protein
MNALFSVLSNGEFAVLFWATIGGAIVFLGLAIERFADWMDDRFLGGYEPHKALELSGWCILMLGIFIEIAVGGWSSHRAWENDPLNQPISEVSAVINIRVRGRDNVELAMETNSPTVAYMELCSGFIGIPSVITGLPYPYPVPVPGHSLLESDRFEVWQSSQFLLPASQPHDFHEYELKFHSSLAVELLVAKDEHKVKEIDNIKALAITLKFLPHDSEILKGTAVITINDTRKIFNIPHQTNSCPYPDSPGIARYFELVATNVVQTIGK